MGFDPPVEAMRLAIEAASGTDAPDRETVAAVLEEGARFAREVLAPLNHSGDREGARLENGVVRTPTGFPDAYRAFVAGGWNGVGFAEAHGGQGLPLVLATALAEMWDAANMSFGLCPLLTAGAVEALERHGSAALQATYLEKLVRGEWTGTMNLTEPQAGSDVGALKARAVPEGEAWRITGQKIYITYGEHDLAENIVHFVLARTPNSPAGTRGISLFLVPKFLPDADGRPGRRNDVRCVGIERKLGIHASPTCVLAYGDEEGALGWLVGEENAGMACMFTMMNAARLAVGRQGVAISERAYQQARMHAMARVQGTPMGQSPGAPIAWHPDVRRMLLTIRARTEAARALTYYAAAQLDRGRGGDRAALARAELLVPMVKAWATDLGVENASLAVQVHGGMGFIEETGAAQHLRDSRIAPIYEGTNGIQALDLLNRKLTRDEGAAMAALVQEVRALDTTLAASGADFAALRGGLTHGAAMLEATTRALLAIQAASPAAAAAGATPYLTLAASVTAAWRLAQAALLAKGGEARLAEESLLVARFFVESVLPGALAGSAAVVGGATVLAYQPDAA